MKNRQAIWWIGIVAGIGLLMVLALMTGRYAVSFHDLKSSLAFLLGHNTDMSNPIFVIVSIRLPRILMALLIGSSLAVSGVTTQALFKNPLASPKILGVFSGAAFGIAFGLTVFHNAFYAYITAFCFGIGAVGMTYTLGKQKEGHSVLMLLLAGIVVDALFTSLLALVQFNANVETELPSIVYWLMGSLSGTTFQDVQWVFIPVVLSIVILYAVRWKLNILSLSSEEAISLGFNIKLYKGLVITLVTILSAISVFVCGIIGWVGLITPHIGRLLVGADHRKLVPVSIVIGSVYLLLIDTACRGLFEIEMPLSIMTALVGAPFFAYLVKSKGGVWQ